jgi:hypothetical protein
VTDERERAIIRVFTPYLESTINAMDIVDELFSRKVIKYTDSEFIRAKYQTMGNTYATIVLLERMQCRLAPGKWYYEFLDVLVHKNLKHVVEEIEPDFLQCPDQFRPCNGKFEQGIFSIRLPIKCICLFKGIYLYQYKI